MAFAQDSLGEKRTADIRLEEIESSAVDGRPVWLITLSSLPPLDDTAFTMRRLAQTMGSLGADAGREYKVFTVSKETGEILSMRIRLLATPGQ